MSKLHVCQKLRIKIYFYRKGFYEKYAYEFFPIPFTKEHRNSLKLENQNDLKPLSVYNYVIPTAFMVGGMLISFVAFVIEKVNGGPKPYEEY